MTAQEFNRRIRNADRGDRITYHMGDLQFDRTQEGAGLLRELANAAWASYKTGVAVLVQKRIGANNFAYMAIKVQDNR